jgi:hypothetical protein
MQLKFISQVWKYVNDTFNLLLTSHLDSRLMVFNKFNSCFTLFINLEMWKPFVHLFWKILFIFMFKGVEKSLVYQKIISVSTCHEYITKVLVYQWHMVKFFCYNWKMSKCTSSFKFSYVRFISQVWNYVYDTFNVLLTSHLDNRLMFF